MASLVEESKNILFGKVELNWQYNKDDEMIEKILVLRNHIKQEILTLPFEKFKILITDYLYFKGLTVECAPNNNEFCNVSLSRDKRVRGIVVLSKKMKEIKDIINEFNIRRSNLLYLVSVDIKIVEEIKRSYPFCIIINIEEISKDIADIGFIDIVRRTYLNSIKKWPDIGKSFEEWEERILGRNREEILAINSHL